MVKSMGHLLGSEINNYRHNKNGGVAQLVERALCKREAPGSKPGISNFRLNNYLINYLIHMAGSISLVVRTPVCGTGSPSSNLG